MTTLPNRPRTALIVIDVQNGVVDGAPKRDDVVANINDLVGQARAQGVPVIWVQHNDDGLPRGSAEWELVPELARGDSEPLVHKNYGDSFEDTSLENVLSGLGVGRLVVAGANGRDHGSNPADHQGNSRHRPHGRHSRPIVRDERH